MIDFDAFLPLIEPNATNAPEPLIFQSLRLAAIRFCERTRLWRDSDTIVTDGVEEEPIAVPNDSVLFEVAACAQGRRHLTPITLAELAIRRPLWRTECVGGCDGSRWYVCPSWGTIWAIPRCPGTLTVETVLKPSATARTLPDFMLDQYGTDIARGASSLVLAKPNAAFGNAQLAMALGGMFEQRLGTLSNMGSAGQQKAKARTRARFM
jgi:hypothetical protein